MWIGQQVWASWRVGKWLRSRSLLFRISISALLMVALAQDRGSQETVNIRVRSDLVLINAVVTDRRGGVITDLDAARFHLFEDGGEQAIKSCVSQDGPASIGLILDTSGSMGDKLSALRKAALAFVRAANPSDEYFLLEFRDRPQVVIPFTGDTDQLLLEINSINAGSSTALLDAIYLALREIRGGHHPKKALLVISDGMDNHSRFSAREVRRLALEVDSPIYTINLWKPARSGNRYTIQRRDPGLLEEISVPTGGRTFAVRDSKTLTSTAELISSEIRHEYILGYVPANRQADGRFHHVQIKVESSGGQRLKISHRAGYRAPTK